MVADLLELRQCRQHHTLALDALGSVQLGGGFVDDGSIERRLLFSQRAEYLHLHLLGQIGDDGLIGLESPQDERPGQAFQPLYGLLVAIGLDGDKERPLEFTILT